MIKECVKIQHNIFPGRIERIKSKKKYPEILVKEPGLESV
jgi:hypothetical protein